MMDRYFRGKASHHQPWQYIKEKLKQEPSLWKSIPIAFAQVSALLQVEQQDG